MSGTTRRYRATDKTKTKKPTKNQKKLQAKKSPKFMSSIKRSAKVVGQQAQLNWDMLTQKDALYIKKKYFSRPSTSKDRKGN